MIGPLLQTNLLDVPRVERANSAQEHFMAVEAISYSLWGVHLYWVPAEKYLNIQSYLLSPKFSTELHVSESSIFFSISSTLSLT